MDNIEITYTATKEVPVNLLDNLLCSAFEGGSNYWASSSDNNAKEMGCDYAFQAPLKEDGWFQILDNEEDKTYVVNNYKIKTALKFMAENHPRHFNDLITENADSITGDVFLQLCCFGKVIYG